MIFVASSHFHFLYVCVSSILISDHPISHLGSHRFSVGVAYLVPTRGDFFYARRWAIMASKEPCFPSQPWRPAVQMWHAGRRPCSSWIWQPWSSGFNFNHSGHRKKVFSIHLKRESNVSLTGKENVESRAIRVEVYSISYSFMQSCTLYWFSMSNIAKVQIIVQTLHAIQNKTQCETLLKTIYSLYIQSQFVFCLPLMVLWS